MPGDSNAPGLLSVATISIVDVFAKQIEMSAQLGVINEKLADLPDHEARLRVLEAAKAKLYGAAAVIGLLGGTAGTWVTLALTHGRT